MDVSRCSSCDRPISWVKTVNGKRMPVDADKSWAGNLEIINGVAHRVAKGGPRVLLYVSHFATCPNAKQHKRKRPAQAKRGQGPAPLSDKDWEKVMARNGLCKLNLRPNPERIHLTQEEPNRRREEIDQTVRKVIIECVAGRSPWPLLLWGGPGRGKTCAALCLLDQTVGPYLTVPKLCQTIIDCQKDKCTSKDIFQLSSGAVLTKWNPSWTVWNVTPTQLWEHMRAWAFVVLDELGGRDVASEAHREAVKLTLDARSSKPLVLCSNKCPEELKRIYGGPISSRLEGGTICEVTGPDRRKTPCE